MLSSTKLLLLSSTESIHDSTDSHMDGRVFSACRAAVTDSAALVLQAEPLRAPAGLPAAAQLRG